MCLVVFEQTRTADANVSRPLMDVTILGHGIGRFPGESVNRGIPTRLICIPTTTSTTLLTP